LKATDEEKEETHKESSDKKHRTTAPSVDVDNGGDGECDVEDILNGCGDERAATTGDAGRFEDEDDVVPAHLISTCLDGSYVKTRIIMFMPVSWDHICKEHPRKTRRPMPGARRSAYDLAP
jgi:hypothetical protein